MGEIYQRIGPESEAVACFRKARELDPSVTVPPELDLNPAQSPASPAKPVKKGFFGGRGGKS
jgi:hypothetical protein